MGPVFAADQSPAEEEVGCGVTGAEEVTGALGQVSTGVPTLLV